jgi:DNA polymerase-3 subunit epsilon
VDEGAFRVHGISTEFLSDKPLFETIVDEFLTFIDGSELIIHNAPFDVGFLNAELKHIQWPKVLGDHCQVFDTLEFARKKHPGQRNSLDALCKRYDIDNSNRQLHGALLDAEILARVYLAMTGGQGSLFADDLSPTEHAVVTPENTGFAPRDLPVIPASAEELAEHLACVDFIVKKSNVDRWKAE